MWIYGTFIFVALLTGIYACYFFKPFYFKLIVILLAITLFNEMIFAPYLCDRLHIHRNIAYNAFSLIDMSVWSFIFFKIYSGLDAQKFIFHSAAVIFVYSFSELFFLKGWTVLHIDSFRVYEIFIILLSIIYLYGLLKREYYRITIDPLFWMCAACMLYHSVLILTFTLRMDAEYWHFKNAKEVFFFLQILADALYYLLLCCMFISGILYSKSQKKDTSYLK